MLLSASKLKTCAFPKLGSGLDSMTKLEIPMRTKLIRYAAALMWVSLLPAYALGADGAPMRAIFFNNVALIIQDPALPISIDGRLPTAGHPWYEPRMFAPAPPPQDLNPRIEVCSSIEPSNVLRPPGRVVPSPFDLTTFTITPIGAGTFAYASQWPEVFTPRDARNTVVLTLVNRAKSLLFRTNLDLQYSVDRDVIEESTGTQTITVRLTPRAANQAIIVRLRSERTQDADAQFVAGTADPPPSSQTSTSVIWNAANPPINQTLTFTVEAEVRNLASPTAVRHTPDLLVTASLPATVVGMAVGDTVTFPQAFLPEGINQVQYSISREANWNFEFADRTLVDIREVTELVPN
jgi:hypothetical protein